MRPMHRRGVPVRAADLADNRPRAPARHGRDRPFRRQGRGRRRPFNHGLLRQAHGHRGLRRNQAGHPRGQVSRPHGRASRQHGRTSRPRARVSRPHGQANRERDRIVQRHCQACQAAERDRRAHGRQALDRQVSAPLGPVRPATVHLALGLRPHNCLNSASRCGHPSRRDGARRGTVRRDGVRHIITRPTIVRRIGIGAAIIGIRVGDGISLLSWQVRRLSM
ncbi:hypothetical protein shim_29210 [Shimia sp. SK013]|nr:hypothetical protein shim_29210 [Shimia sp. SK013]